MILSYGDRREDSFSLESDSSCCSDSASKDLKYIDEIHSFTGSLPQPNPNEANKEQRAKNMFALEGLEDPASKRGRQTDQKILNSQTTFTNEGMAADFANLRIMMNKQKQYERETEEIDLKALHFSNDTLSLLNTSLCKQRGFLDSDLDLSNCSALHNPEKAKVEKRCHSSESFQNLIDHFECMEDDKKKKKNLKKINSHDGNEGATTANIRSLNYENLKELLKSEENVSLSMSLSNIYTNQINNEANQNNSTSKKKENFIPKSEILFKGDNTMSIKSDMYYENTTISRNGTTFPMNPMLNYYEMLSPNKPMGTKAIMQIEEAYEDLTSPNRSRSNSGYQNNQSSFNTGMSDSTTQQYTAGNNILYTQINHFNINPTPQSEINVNQFKKNNYNYPTNFQISQNHNFSNLPNEELGKIAEYISRDQQGCRFLQKKIAEDAHFANEILFYHIEESLVDLIIDPFGNYLIQKLLERLDNAKLLHVIALISPHFFQISTSPHGTRVVQKLIDYLNTEEKLHRFNYSFSQYIIQLSEDSNANHIVQKYLYSIGSPINQFVYDILQQNLDEICTDKHGCCVMQKAIDAADSNQKEHLVQMILQKSPWYMSDQYANYVVQFIISIGEPSINRQISEMFIDDIRKLSRQKHSSNVIEKVFEHSNSEIHEFIVSQMVQGDVDTITSELIDDNYGNYVLQKAVAVAKGDNRLKLMKSIGNNIDKLKAVPFGNKLLNRFLNSYKELPSLINKNSVGNLKLNCTNKNLSNSHNVSKNKGFVNFNSSSNYSNTPYLYSPLNQVSQLNNTFPNFCTYQACPSNIMDLPYNPMLVNTKGFTHQMVYHNFVHRNSNVN